MTPATRIATKQLPPGLVDTFHQFRGGTDGHQWSLGEAVAEAVTELAGQYSIGFIQREAAKAAEVSPAQVRKCCETWQAATEGGYRANDLFDVLTFEHHATVRYLPLADALTWLTRCVASADDYGGRPMPASVLAKKLAELKDQPAVDPREYIDRAWALIGKALDAGAAAGVSEKALAQWRQAADLLREG